VTNLLSDNHDDLSAKSAVQSLHQCEQLTTWSC